MRTPDKPKAKKGSSEKPGEISPQLQQQLDLIGKGFEKKSVY